MEEVKYAKYVKGKEPLPLCQECVELNIVPPIKQGRTTNFVERGRQRRETQTRKDDEAITRGLGKTQKKRKRSKK